MIGIHKNHPTAYFDGARGFAVLLVWLSHTSGRGQEIASWFSFHGLGHIGVMLFFVLSGYLLSLPFKEGKKFVFSEYMVRRFLRIIPLYFVVLIGVYLFQAYSNEVNEQYLHIEQGFKGFLKHLLLLRGDGIFWTIPTEFMFYLFLPFIAIFLSRQNLIRYALVCFFALLYGTYHLAIYVNIIDMPSLMFIEVRSHSQYLDVFTIGVVFGLLSKNSPITEYYESHKKILNISIFLSFAVTVIFTVILVCKSIFIFNQPFYHVRFVSFFYALIFALTLYSAQMGNSYIRRFFESKILVYMGVVGYSWYLLHMPVLQMVNFLNLPSWILFLISTVVITAISTVTYLFIEEPFIRLGKFLSSKILTKNAKGLANARI